MIKILDLAPQIFVCRISSADRIRAIDHEIAIELPDDLAAMMFSDIDESLLMQTIDAGKPARQTFDSNHR